MEILDHKPDATTVCSGVGLAQARAWGALTTDASERVWLVVGKFVTVV